MRRSMLTTLPVLLLAGGMILSGCVGEENTPAAEPAETVPTTDLPETTPTAELTPTADLPADWQLAGGAGYQIGLPPGWFDASRALADDEFMDGLAGELGESIEDADFSALVEEALRDDALDLVAVRIADLTADFATNFNIVVQPRGLLDEPEVVLELAEDIVSAFGAEFTHAAEATVGDLPTVEVSYDLPRPDGTVVAGVQDYMFADDVIYIATYTATEPDLDLWSSVLDTFTPTD